MKRIAWLIFPVIVAALAPIPSIAADPDCIYRECWLAGSGETYCDSCNSGHFPDQCFFYARKKEYYVLCRGCASVCQVIPPLVGESDTNSDFLEAKASTCATALSDSNNGVVDAYFFAVDLAGSALVIERLHYDAPELMLHLASSDMTQMSGVKDGMLLHAPVDQRYSVARSKVIPSVEFVRRALLGTLVEEDVEEFTTRTDEGTVLQIESYPEILPDGNVILHMRSLLVTINDSGDAQILDVLNRATVTLTLLEKSYASVKVEGGSLANAALYRPIAAEILP